VLPIAPGVSHVTRFRGPLLLILNDESAFLLLGGVFDIDDTPCDGDAGELDPPG